MIEHIWTVICSNAIIDQDTNNISIFNILEQVNIPEDAVKNQAIGINVELLTLWIRSDLSKPARGISQVNLVAPDGEVIQSSESQLDLSQFERLRSRSLYQGLAYRGEGVYHFAVEYKADEQADWQQVASIPLKVMLVHEGDNT
ncbi:MAG: hypothetical protein P4L50_09855 [Anaerolineaceae bacterium]|nr:hypothetical protein [Anaerolineaceae bacterium]